MASGCWLYIYILLSLVWVLTHYLSPRLGARLQFASTKHCAQASSLSHATPPTPNPRLFIIYSLTCLMSWTIIFCSNIFLHLKRVLLEIIHFNVHPHSPSRTFHAVSCITAVKRMQTAYDQGQVQFLLWLLKLHLLKCSYIQHADHLSYMFRIINAGNYHRHRND